LEVRITRAALVGYLVLAVLVGLTLGVGLLVWQRFVLLGLVDDAETRLVDARKETLGAADRISALQAASASASQTIAQLRKQNSKLASDLAVAQGQSADSGSGATKSGSVTILSRGVSPAVVEAGKPIALSVRVKGSPDKVKMRVVVKSGGGYDKTFTLSRVGSSGGVQTWKSTVNAPGDAGEYRYYATAYLGGVKTEMPGVSAWTFLVE
jgi:hypothetical protein